MGDKLKSLGREMQRVIDLGMIDHWMRGLGDIIPRSPTQSQDGFNTHLITYDSADSIDAEHVQKLAGCRQLLTACSQQNIGIDIKFIDDGHLSVIFKPENQFSKSLVFGTSYHNVLPTLFGLKTLRRT